MCQYTTHGMIHEYMIHIVPTCSTNTLGYMWLHWHTYSLHHKTPLMYMDIAGLVVISYDMYFMWGCHLWWLWGRGSTYMFRHMQDTITCWIINSMKWLGGNVFECIFFSPCSCMVHGCFVMALNAIEALVSAGYSQVAHQRPCAGHMVHRRQRCTMLEHRRIHNHVICLVYIYVERACNAVLYIASAQ